MIETASQFRGIFEFQYDESSACQGRLQGFSLTVFFEQIVGNFRLQNAQFATKQLIVVTTKPCDSQLISTPKSSTDVGVLKFLAKHDFCFWREYNIAI